MDGKLLIGIWGMSRGDNTGVCPIYKIPIEFTIYGI